MDTNLIETKVDGELVYQGGVLRVQRDRVALPDGKITAREFVLHPGAVVILPLLDDGSVLMERQYRYPLDRVFIEFPAGKIDAGESHLACARRELLEETGYTASDWQFVSTIHNAIAYSDEHLELFLARGLVAGERRLDEGEFLDVFTASATQLYDWCRAGQITDAKTLIGALWLQNVQSGAWPLDWQAVGAA